MKKIKLFILMLSLCSLGYGQGYHLLEYDSLTGFEKYVWFQDSAELESVLSVIYDSITEYDLVIDTTANKLCLERGHVLGDVIMRTAMYCSPYVIDTDSTTVMVYPACNYESFTCKRCGKYVSRLEKERRVIVWDSRDRR